VLESGDKIHRNKVSLQVIIDFISFKFIATSWHPLNGSRRKFWT